MAEELELSLGLSLNGRFGTDPNSTKNEDNYLMRSASSVSNLLEVSSMMKQQQTLTRTCSLPLEVEEETRKRKEIQMLRRMEAKRKRSEKQRRENGIVAGGGGSGAFEMVHGKMDFLVNGDPRQGFSGRGFESKPGFRSGLGGGDNGGGGLPPAPLSQGSSASSSGTSEFDSQTPPPPPSGTNKSAEAKSPQSVQSFSDQNEQRPVLWSAEPKRLRKTASEDVTHLTPSRSISEASTIIKNVLADMPSVSTKGSGPNGKRVEGFLYRYRKGEEVRIVCVCHGNFLTPGEFIKHAGGGDVENPLRHIVVNPAPF